MKIQPTILRLASLGLVVGALAIPTADQPAKTKVRRQSVPEIMADIESSLARIQVLADRRAAVDAELLRLHKAGKLLTTGRNRQKMR